MRFGPPRHHANVDGPLPFKLRTMYTGWRPESNRLRLGLFRVGRHGLHGQRHHRAGREPLRGRPRVDTKVCGSPSLTPYDSFLLFPWSLPPQHRRRESTNRWLPERAASPYPSCHIPCMPRPVPGSMSPQLLCFWWAWYMGRHNRKP